MALPREHKAPPRSKRSKNQIEEDKAAAKAARPEPPAAPPRPRPPATIAARARDIQGDITRHKLAPFVFEVLGVAVEEGWTSCIKVHFRTIDRTHGTPLELWYNHRFTAPSRYTFGQAAREPEQDALEREIKEAITLAMQHELAESFLRADGSYVEDPHPEEATYGRREAPPLGFNTPAQISPDGCTDPEALRRSFVAQGHLV